MGKYGVLGVAWVVGAVVLFVVVRRSASKAAGAVSGVVSGAGSAASAAVDLAEVALRDSVRLTGDADSDLERYLALGYMRRNADGFTEITEAGERYIERQHGS